VNSLKRRAIYSILGVITVALISGYLLWKLMIQGDSLGQLGLIGVSIAAMLSHLTVVARDMFIPLFLPLASVYHPVILGTAAGTGAAIGEVTTYFLGWGVAESMEPLNGSEDRIARWINKYGLWAVLLVALTPLPDTPIVILAGSKKLPFRKLALVEILGKSTLYSLGALMGGLVYSGLENTIGTLLASVFIVIGSLIFSVAVTWKPTRDILFGWMEKLIPQMKE
jgi:membrane protein YqaA with SNARE-associated domain